MKHILLTSYMVLGLILVDDIHLFATDSEWKMELVRGTTTVDASSGNRTDIYKVSRKTGESSKICDLSDLGIYHPGKSQYNEKINVLVVQDMGNTSQHLKVVDLNKKQTVKEINIPTSEPDVKFQFEQDNNALYVTYWDPVSNNWTTGVYYKDYSQILKIAGFVIDGHGPWVEKNGQFDWLLGYDTKSKEDKLLMVDLANAKVIGEKDLRKLAIKNELPRIRDYKNGAFLLEYRKQKGSVETETYILYSANNEKILGRIDGVSYHIGTVSLDESQRIIINEAQPVVTNGKQKDRRYTGKVKVYDFSKNRMTKEIDVGEGATVETIDNGVIYYRQNNKTQKKSFE